MQRFFRKTLVSLLVGVLMVGLSVSPARRASAGASPQAIISGFRKQPDNEFFGTLYATINGVEKKIDDAVIDAWVIESGRNLLYSKRDGAGGFENEGESLHVYDPQTGKSRKVMSEYYAVHKVTEVRTTRGKTALLVTMTDGGLGAFYLAVVDPSRGQVFFRKFARLLSHKGDLIRLGLYNQDIDWTQFYDNEDAKVRPSKTESYNLSALLKRPVIINKRKQP